jgi:serine/threonine-protein kinase
VFHFSELAPGPDGIAPTLRNLAAQLAGAWQLTPEDIDPMLIDASSRADFFDALLGKAAAHRDRLAPREPIVVVVDALDEAGTPMGQNVLGLPRTLPPKVYVIVTQRPVRVRLAIDSPRHVCTVDAHGDGNRRDQKAYLEQVLASRPDWGTEEAAHIVETLLAKSDGNWVYLHHIVSEIDGGRRSVHHLDRLPSGVWQFYAQFWESWRDAHRNDWEGGHLPVLTSLAAIRQNAATCELLLAAVRRGDGRGAGALSSVPFQPSRLPRRTGRGRSPDGPGAVVRAGDCRRDPPGPRPYRGSLSCRVGWTRSEAEAAGRSRTT